MSARLRLAATTLLLPLLAVPVAHAGPVSCAWVQDAIDDGTGTAAAAKSPMSDSSMDLEKMALASDGKRVTAWLKVYALAGADQYAPTGRRFTLAFTARTGGKDVRKEVHVLLPAMGPPSADNGATIVTDYTGFEIHVTAQLAKVGLAGLKVAKRKPPTPADRFVHLNAVVERWRGDLATGGAIGDRVDELDGSYAYDHATASCVKVGR